MAEPKYQCTAFNADGTRCGRNANLPDMEGKRMLCDIHAWETWRYGKDILPILEAIGQGTVPKLPAARSLMWVLMEAPVVAMQIIISGYAAMVGAMEAALEARDPNLALEIVSLGSHALAAKAAAELLSIPEEKRELLMLQSGLGDFVKSYRALVEKEEADR